MSKAATKTGERCPTRPRQSPKPCLSAKPQTNKVKAVSLLSGDLLLGYYKNATDAKARGRGSSFADAKTSNITLTFGVGKFAALSITYDPKRDWSPKHLLDSPGTLELNGGCWFGPNDKWTHATRDEAFAECAKFNAKPAAERPVYVGYPDGSAHVCDDDFEWLIPVEIGKALKNTTVDFEYRNGIGRMTIEQQLPILLVKPTAAEVKRFTAMFAKGTR